MAKSALLKLASGTDLRYLNPNEYSSHRQLKIIKHLLESTTHVLCERLTHPQSQIRIFALEAYHETLVNKNISKELSCASDQTIYDVLSLLNPKLDDVKNNLLIYGLIVFFISAPIYFYKSYLKYQVVMKSGYLSIHTGIETAIEYPIWTFGVGILLEAAFCFIIASRPSFKIFFLVFIIFFSLKYFDSMRGQRVLVAIPIVFFVWYVIKNHLMKFNLKSIILCFLSFIIISDMQRVKAHELRSKNE